jgi:hypothetical protein
MNRSVRPALIIAMVVALVTAGCGIPDDTAVVPVGPGPSKGASTGGDTSPIKRLRTDTTDKSTFVKNFLTAAAGDYDSATDEVKKFMTGEAAASFKPASADIKVVHLEEEPLINPGQPDAAITVRQIGTLDAAGVLTPAGPGADPSRYKIGVGSVDGQPGLFVTNAPPALMITDAALAEFYAPRAIYFWNINHTGLVPDVRYMSLSVPREQQPTAVLTWLVNGPADWLKPVVDTLPPGTKLTGNVPAVSNDTLQVNLSSQALDTSKDPDAFDLLQRQLRWSLRANMPKALDLLPGALELTVGHDKQTYRGDGGYLDSNALYRRPNDPERFAVYEGQIRRLKRSRNPEDALPVTAAANQKVQMASFGGASTNRTYAALVVKDAGHPELRVGSTEAGKQATLRKISLPAPIGRPVWAVSPPVGTVDGTVGLVAAKGHLYSFAPDGTSFHQVGGLDNITAVAVAGDARRVALISGNQLYLAALSTEDGVQISSPTLIRTEMAGLTAVDWGSEGALVVSGRMPDDFNRVWVMDVSIDGASQTPRLTGLGSNLLAYLTAYPASPSQIGGTGVPVAYESTGGAFDESSSEKIVVADLAEPVTNPRAGVLVTAPFFLN